MKPTISLIVPVLGLLLAPLLTGIVNFIKSWLGGRCGAPLLQPYFDIWKLLQKSAVYGKGTSWLFQAGPIVSLAAMVTALFLVPMGSLGSPLWSSCDAVFLVALLALARLFSVLATFESGSPNVTFAAFREARYSLLVEPALILSLTAVGRISEAGLELSLIHEMVTFSLWSQSGLILILVAISLGMIIICETSRPLVSDPTDPLELSSIHETLSLQHSGPDLAFATYAVSLKQWLLGTLLLNVTLPAQTHSLIPIAFISMLTDVTIALCGMFLLAVITGFVESSRARIRLFRVPQLLIGATALAALALALTVQPERTIP